MQSRLTRREPPFNQERHYNGCKTDLKTKIPSSLAVRIVRRITLHGRASYEQANERCFRETSVKLGKYERCLINVKGRWSCIVHVANTCHAVSLKEMRRNERAEAEARENGAKNEETRSLRVTEELTPLPLK